MRTELRKATNVDFDADTLHVHLSDESKLDVYAFPGRDGVPVVQIDTDGDAGRIRIMLNDAPVWDGDPEVMGPMDRIHALLDQKAWSPDTLDAIADIVRSTGREVRDDA